jgi:hypothetical protein
MLGLACEGSARGRSRFARGLRGVFFGGGRGGGCLRVVRGVKLTLWGFLASMFVQRTKSPPWCAWRAVRVAYMVGCLGRGVGLTPRTPRAHRVRGRPLISTPRRPLADPSQTPRGARLVRGARGLRGGIKRAWVPPSGVGAGRGWRACWRSRLRP